LSEFNYPLLTSDHSVQIEAAKNFKELGVFSQSWVESNDLSTIKSKPLQMWPIGLSIFIYLFGFITHNLIYAEILFQCIGSILFIVGIFKILKLFNLSNHFLSLFLLLYAFNYAPFLYLGSTDLFTSSLFIWIVYYSISEIMREGNSLIYLFLISFLSFITAILRFACIPNLIIIPFVFF